MVITTIAQRDSRTGSSGSKSATPLTAKTKPCKVFRKGGADSRCVCICECVCVCECVVQIAGVCMCVCLGVCVFGSVCVCVCVCL